MINRRRIIPHDHRGSYETFETMVEESFLSDSERNEHPFPVVTITMQVTEACNLNCSYCYQHHKSKKRMTLETAKKALDVILENKSYINIEEKRGVILDFIGGEPLLEIDLISEIYDYFIQKCINMNSPWLDCHRISLCSNGVLYNDPKVKKFIKEHLDVLSITISVDGPEYVHDACRVFHDGSGSFSYAVKAMDDVRDTFGVRNTKATISPDNVHHMGDIVKFFYEDHGFNTILLNCTYEGPWDINTCRVLYDQMIKISDYCYTHDTYSSLYISLFEETFFEPIDYTEPGENKNWCGGCGQMIAVNPDGNIYPCLRYMESSIGRDKNPIIIGNINHGIAHTDSEKCWINELKQVTATSQSTEDCIHCPIAKGCGWCSAYNYEIFGTVNKRVTNICLAHKMRALANIDYWNRFYENHHINNVYDTFLSRDEMIKLVGEDESDRLLNLIENQRKRGI